MAYENNPYAPYASQLAQSAAMPMREASLRNKADEAIKHLSEAHTMLSSLELAIRGPQPEAVGKTHVGEHDSMGLRTSLDTLSGDAARLCSRLLSLLEEL